MAMWSDVEVLTNEDTNTVRLSSVTGEDNGNGLYQVDTLVKISSANEVRNATNFHTVVYPLAFPQRRIRGLLKE